ncbi:N-lysine methyltransferase SETD8 [Microtus ochrogaster]|uniref:N-lysine methyltransferase SETD8 n=1 Tax=Microtus ochrogaster TaxID=79684 RepID=A0A8J6G047_MICOH|nr:N-lysine methyltransferase SETD8 [Microtus ochrogaster]
MEAGVPENVFVGQSKIYAYMSPNKCSGMCSPLQEENSVAHHEVKCQGKPLAGIYRKREEKRNAGNPIRSSVKSDEQRRSKSVGIAKLHDIDGVPHLTLIASRDIAAGEELLYDCGDRSKASIEAYPWLKH